MRVVPPGIGRYCRTRDSKCRRLHFLQARTRNPQDITERNQAQPERNTGTGIAILACLYLFSRLAAQQSMAERNRAKYRDCNAVCVRVVLWKTGRPRKARYRYTIRPRTSPCFSLQSAVLANSAMNSTASRPCFCVARRNRAWQSETGQNTGTGIAYFACLYLFLHGPAQQSMACDKTLGFGQINLSPRRNKSASGRSLFRGPGR